MIYLKPGVKVLPLPESVPPERFIGAGCGLPTAVHAIERAEIMLGDTVVVQGSGPVGLTAAILAQLSGATQRHRHRRAGAAPGRGAAHRRGHDARHRKATTRRGTRATRARRYRRARRRHDHRGQRQPQGGATRGLAITRDAGRYVIVGQYTDLGDIPVNPHLDINRKHLEMRGSWGSDFSHFWRGAARGGQARRALSVGALYLAPLQPGGGQPGAGRCGALSHRQGADRSARLMVTRMMTRG